MRAGVLRTAACAVLLSACPTRAPEDETPPANDHEPQLGSEFRRKAHLDGWARLADPAARTLALADPISASQLGLAPLGPEPLTPEAKSAVRIASRKVARDAREIDPQFLSDQDAGILAALVFATARIEDQTAPVSPGRSDPAIAVNAANRLVAEIEYRLAHGACSDCAGALEQLATTLAASARDLGAASVESLTAASADLGVLARRLESLLRIASKPGDDLKSAVEQATTAAHDLAESHASRVASLRKASEIDWGTPTTPARGDRELSRLPARVGEAELLRRLDVEEGLRASARSLFDSSLVALGRLRQAANSAPADVLGTKPSSPDETRCTRLSGPAQAWLQDKLGDDQTIDCAAITRGIGKPISDVDLVLRIIDWGVVEPGRRTRRRQQPQLLALIGGGIAPTSQRDSAAVAVLGAVEGSSGLRPAIERSRRDLCLAAAAVWIHGQLGPDEALHTSLGPTCGDVDRLVSAAVARPRAALAGLGLGRLADGGAAANLDTLWWGPLGLDMIVLGPSKRQDPAPGKIQTRVLEPNVDAKQ